jgi:hypothetical protein
MKPRALVRVTSTLGEPHLDDIRFGEVYAIDQCARNLSVAYKSVRQRKMPHAVLCRGTRAVLH